MRIEQLVAIVTFFLLVGCQENKKGATPSIAGDTLIGSLQKKIIGKWGGGDSHPILEIRSDSIYYFEKDSAFLYRLKGIHLW